MLLKKLKCNEKDEFAKFTIDLQGALEKEFFGQHLAAEIILDSIAAHWNGEPRRPLVLSFHGWAGSGKTYLAQHIAKALFRNGEKSHYYKHFTQGYDFHGKSEHHFPSQRVSPSIPISIKNSLVELWKVQRLNYSLLVSS